MANLPTGTVTLLSTDIEGSTRQWEAHASAMRTALPRHDTLLRQCINDHDGHVFKTGCLRAVWRHLARAAEDRLPAAGAVSATLTRKRRVMSRNCVLSALAVASSGSRRGAAPAQCKQRGETEGEPGNAFCKGCQYIAQVMHTQIDST